MTNREHSRLFLSGWCPPNHGDRRPAPVRGPPRLVIGLRFSCPLDDYVMPREFQGGMSFERCLFGRESVFLCQHLRWPVAPANTRSKRWERKRGKTHRPARKVARVHKSGSVFFNVEKSTTPSRSPYPATSVVGRVGGSRAIGAAAISSGVRMRLANREAWRPARMRKTREMRQMSVPTLRGNGNGFTPIWGVLNFYTPRTCEGAL